MNDRALDEYGVGLEWAAYSPDMNPCDFFLWGYLKSKVYKHNPKTLEELAELIRREADAIPEQIFRDAIESMKGRAQKMINAEGGRFQYY